MPIHDDGQYEMLEDGISVKNQIIKELKRELTDCREQLNDALRYGFGKNIESTVLHREIMELSTYINMRLGDEENRVHGNKEE